MKLSLAAALATVVLTSGLLAQNPTWAEQLHKTKTGRWPTGVEQRLKAEKQAREQQRQGQLNNLFAILDHNQDGTISAHEWRQANQPEAAAPNRGG